jgi:hypothetical protein
MISIFRKIHKQTNYLLTLNFKIMRKTFNLFLMLLVTGFVFGQNAQRFVIIEEFTQASCPPCASVNPAFNALLHDPANVTKIVSIKYQVSWPGFDPMYLQNTADVENRVALYDVTSVPEAVLDGNVWQGFPGSFTQAMINNEYAVPSPFTISLMHNLSADVDSVFITCVITAEQAVAGTLAAHVVLVEKEINFATPPGTNGESEFYEVMKKMLPDANGTPLPATWAPGDVQTITFAIPLPDWYYNLQQIEVVAFVQEAGTKNIKQGALSSPIALIGDPGLDAGLAGATIDSFVCTLPLIPAVVLKNFGSVTLTSCDINYQIDDAGPVTTFAWTGSLAASATANVTLANITSVSSSAHSIKMWVSNPNGILDFYPMNNGAVRPFMYTAFGNAPPLQQDFQGATFPPAGYMIDNPDYGKTWELRTDVGGWSQSSSSMFIDFFAYYEAGELDFFYLPAADLSSATSAALIFDVAYAQYSASYQDGLKVEVSTDCGATWIQLYMKMGFALATAPSTTSSFVPTATQWRNETIDLTTYLGNNTVFIRFVGINDWGNNLFVDNINLTNVTGIIEIPTADIQVYPNPFTTTTTVAVNLENSAMVSLSLVNLLGQSVLSQNFGQLSAGLNTLTLDGAALKAGLYNLYITIDGLNTSRKVYIVK